MNLQVQCIITFIYIYFIYLKIFIKGFETANMVFFVFFILTLICFICVCNFFINFNILLYKCVMFSVFFSPVWYFLFVSFGSVCFCFFVSAIVCCIYATNLHIHVVKPAL